MGQRLALALTCTLTVRLATCLNCFIWDLFLCHFFTWCFCVLDRFRMAVLMDGRWFPYVESSSKKEGKKEAADVALRVLMAEGSYQQNDTPASVCAFLSL